MPDEHSQPPPRPREIRLPGFIKEDVGLGDAIKRATATFGIKPCGPCAERAARLNRRIVLSPRGGRGRST
jgi:hypothetical protein